MKYINSLYFSLPTEHRMSYDSENIKPYKEQINMANKECYTKGHYNRGIE